ncbi:hypothetical protein ACRARG_06885 [Pseudooceanicola sp. C21-150M6]|uniref:hypothetical protein n=1 Tax=Pseudooceanicola sp. C21-150M6 TaxID=3434355 RepID=UPI003D7FF262
MSFIRPELQAALWRWREVLVALAVAALGLYWALSTFGLLSWIGWALVLTGLGFGAAGVQRARFRSEGQGPGVVTVDEGQIAYFGPLTGGAVAVSELSRLSLDGHHIPPCWALAQPGQEELLVPVNAAGAEDLFDIFATLPGIRTDRMLEELRRAKGPHRVVIWEKPQARPRLH